LRYDTTARAMGEWLADTWDWSIFFTLTLPDLAAGDRFAGRSHVGVGATEQLLKAWGAGAVEARGGYWWAALEAHRDRPTPHVHGIAGGFDEEPRRSAMWSEWRAIGGGRAQVVPVMSGTAVAVYVAKYVNKGLGKIYVGGSLELRKRGGFVMR